jgi:Ca2+-binding EF-hand superfamily protein
MNKINSCQDSGEIKLKTRADLEKKEFFDSKDNKYRVKKLIQLMEILNKPDFDIELDEMKFTKLKKYKDYSLVKLTEPELKKLLANYDMKEESYINFLGIKKIEDGKTYSLQLDIFLDKFIRINLKEITFEENLDVIFNMYDKDRNGSISKSEALELITYFSELNLLSFDQGTINVIVDAIFKEIDKSRSGNISKLALGRFLEKYKEEDITINPFTKVKTCDSVTKIRRNDSLPITQEQEKELERITRKKDRSKFRKFWVLNKKMAIWTIIYIILCISTGLINRSLEGGRQYATTKAARFFAGVIFFNLALLILFMCLTTITFISTTKLKFYLPLNDTRLYHEVCASVLGVATIVHVLIHIFGDFVEIANKCAKKPAKKYVTVAWLTFANLTGLTGVFALLVFSIMIITPLIPAIRNKRYELFLWTHKLFYIGIILLVLHCRTPDTKRWTFLFVMTLPLILYTIELVFRFVRYCFNKTKVLRVKFLPSGVILLEIQKPKNFTYRCGQYAQVCIPRLSKWQWHPFTFASSPSDDSVFFYINPVGDWTKSLKTLGTKQTGNFKFYLFCNLNYILFILFLIKNNITCI